MLSLFSFILFMLGCSGNNEAAECSEDTPCGFGAVCVEGTCVSNSCATSAQCSMEQYCDKGSCVEGCAADDDCYPGDYCNDELQVCDKAPCTNSQIDCDFKEFCNTGTGECIEASGYYCRDCEQDSDCGGNGNVCLHFGQERDFCGVTCEVESDCPSGFSCFDVTDEEGRPTRQCLTYCWLYIERPEAPSEPPSFAECAVE